jgi:hypothetical protein
MLPFFEILKTKCRILLLFFQAFYVYCIYVCSLTNCGNNKSMGGRHVPALLVLSKFSFHCHLFLVFYFALTVRYMREDMKLGQNPWRKFLFPTFNFGGKGTISVRFESLIARQGNRYRAKLFVLNLFLDNIMRVSFIICPGPVSY